MTSAPPPPASPAFRVLAPADAALASGPRDLVVEASAFGGGSHPTTASCLEALAALAPLDGLGVLDLGSGSGILALAALRLGAAGALCVDVNPDAVACARRNGAANGLEARLRHLLGGPVDVQGERFELVVANVGGGLLLDEAPTVARLAAPGGRLLLSGVLRDFEADLAAAYAREGCAVLERRAAGEFCTLLVRLRLR